MSEEGYRRGEPLATSGGRGFSGFVVVVEACCAPVLGLESCGGADGGEGDVVLVSGLWPWEPWS